MSFPSLKKNSFEEKDKSNLVKLLNLVHNKIDNLNGKEAFEYRDLMAWAQQVLLTKVNDNILGDPVIHELPEKEPKAKKSKTKK